MICTSGGTQGVSRYAHLRVTAAAHPHQRFEVPVTVGGEPGGPAALRAAAFTRVRWAATLDASGDALLAGVRARLEGRATPRFGHLRRALCRIPDTATSLV
jgi:hypothetical protein